LDFTKAPTKLVLPAPEGAETVNNVPILFIKYFRN
jgi:hypothetical protein